MAKHSGKIDFEARLLRPAKPVNATWSFVVLPKAASAKLPTRSMTSVQGSFEGQTFKATLEPDGQGSHWLKVTRALRQKAGVEVGDTVQVTVEATAETTEARVPADLRKALDDAAHARAQWQSLTTVARRDWIQWLDSAKKIETRAKRIVASIDMLVCGKRRVCCFDRSGIYSKAFAAPEAAD